MRRAILMILIDAVYCRLFGKNDSSVVVKLVYDRSSVHQHHNHSVSLGMGYGYCWDSKTLLNSSLLPQRQIQHHDQSRLIMIPIEGGRYSSQLPSMVMMDDKASLIYGDLRLSVKRLVELD